MKDLENHHIGHGEPLRHPDESDPGCNDYSDKAVEAVGMFGCLGTCVMILIVLLIGLCSCSPKTVTIREEVPVYIHDTLSNTVVRVDSFVERDSIYFETLIKGDTISTTKFVEKWRTKVQLKHDTTVQIVEVPVEYTECTEVKVEVPAKLTKMQKAKMFIGSVMLWLLGIAAIGLAVFLIGYYKFKLFRK